MRRAALIAAVLFLAGWPALAQTRSDSIADPDTRAWWKIAEYLASDAMGGRDVGSPGHDRAGRWVADRLREAGLQPAGDAGSYFQRFPLHESRVVSAELSVLGDSGAVARLRFLHDYTVRAADDLPPSLSAPLIFAGYCRPEDLAAASGKIAVCLNTRRQGLTTPSERVRNAQAAGAVGLVQVDDPGFTIEPARWPAPYARTVTLADRPPTPSGGFAVISLSAEAFARIAAGSGRDPVAVLKAGGEKQPLPAFDMAARLEAAFKVTSRDFSAANVLAVLPGSDPQLAAEHVVLSAHLDGYGHGEPVDGDDLYNGALDDAAYVGSLIRFAERHKDRPLKRSILIAAFTGEEKGLLGSIWFVRYPTVPQASMVADINLDQVRPLFPLKLMTVAALGESSLGETARQVAASMGIKVQADPEPERGLLTRSDHYPFMLIGVPATGFIFGYEPGTEAERRYREWYAVRYHRPQDDTSQPMDFQAAGDFNRFFYTLAETVADAPSRPTWTAGSRFAPVVAP